jgi:hypothetical protein
LAIIYIALSDDKANDFSSIIDDDMELKAEEPAFPAFSSGTASICLQEQLPA